MAQSPCDSLPATAKNVVEFRPPAGRILAGAVSEEESFEFLMRVLSLIRAERSTVINDNEK